MPGILLKMGRARGRSAAMACEGCPGFYQIHLPRSRKIPDNSGGNADDPPAGWELLRFHQVPHAIPRGAF